MRLLEIFALFLFGTIAVHGADVRCFAPTTCTTDTESYPNWIQVYPPGSCVNTMQGSFADGAQNRQKRSSDSEENLESLINKETEDRKAADHAMKVLVDKVQDKVDIQEHEMKKFGSDLIRRLLSSEATNDKGFIRREDRAQLLTKMLAKNEKKIKLAALGLCPIAFENCFIPILEPMNYNEGVEKCAEINGKPAMLIDVEHLSYIMRYVATQQSEITVDMYLGMTASENAIVPVENDDMTSFTEWDYAEKSGDVIKPDNRVSIRINKHKELDDEELMIINDPIVKKDGILCEILTDE